MLLLFGRVYHYSKVSFCIRIFFLSFIFTLPFYKPNPLMDQAYGSLFYFEPSFHLYTFLLLFLSPFPSYDLQERGSGDWAGGEYYYLFSNSLASRFLYLPLALFSLFFTWSDQTTSSSHWQQSPRTFPLRFSEKEKRKKKVYISIEGTNLVRPNLRHVG